MIPLRTSRYKVDLGVRAFEFSLRVIGLLDAIDRNLINEIIAKQLLRSATSIGANIVEAQAGSSKRDFAQFMNHALKSANESVYWLALVLRAKRGNSEEIKSLYNEAQELAKILGASLLKLRGKR